MIDTKPFPRYECVCGNSCWTMRVGEWKCKKCNEIMTRWKGENNDN